MKLMVSGRSVKNIYISQLKMKSLPHGNTININGLFDEYNIISLLNFIVMF